MNIWRRGPLRNNPYKRTAFRVSRVPRETVRHRILVQLIGRTKRVINTDPQAHVIEGRPVTEAEINSAEQVLLDPKLRVMEELLEHATERFSLERVRSLAKEAAEAIAAPSSDAQKATNRGGLQSFAKELVWQFLNTSERPDPAFGALEMDLIPPFGRRE